MDGRLHAHPAGILLRSVRSEIHRNVKITVTDRAFLIHDGRVILAGKSEEPVNAPIARKHYLGADFRM